MFSEEDEDDTSALQALILKKRKNMDNFYDSLAAKYADPQPVAKGKGKKGKYLSLGEIEGQEFQSRPVGALSDEEDDGEDRDPELELEDDDEGEDEIQVGAPAVDQDDDDEDEDRAKGGGRG